jgi:hypothetical protein
VRNAIQRLSWNAILFYIYVPQAPCFHALVLCLRINDRDVCIGFPGDEPILVWSFLHLGSGWLVWFDRESGEDMYCTGEQLPAPLSGLLIDPTLYAIHLFLLKLVRLYTVISLEYMSVVACRSSDVSASQCPRRSCAFSVQILCHDLPGHDAAANSAARHCCNRIVAL